MLRDLNDGLFSELSRPRPAIGFYRRELQRNYVTLLVAVYAGQEDRLSLSRALDGRAFRGDPPPPVVPAERRNFSMAVTSPLAEAARQLALDPGRANEARAAIAAASRQLVKKFDAALKRTTDESTRLHLQDLRLQLAD
jgi:hypothetical protein